MTVISVDVPKELSDLVGEAAEAQMLTKAAYVRRALLDAARRDVRKAREEKAKESE